MCRCAERLRSLAEVKKKTQGKYDEDIGKSKYRTKIFNSEITTINEMADFLDA